MARARRFRSSFRGGQRRKKTWIQALVVSDVGGQLLPGIEVPDITPGADSFARIVDTFVPGSADDNGLPTESTVLRIRGQVSIAKSTLQGAGAGSQVAFGICVLDLPNVPGDTDDLPGPMSAPEWDGWMFVRGPSLFDSVDVESTKFDVKAMRKVEGGQRLAFVTEVYQEGLNASQNPIFYSARVLLALP